uniref:Uncharacterized protein n=1 Tax=Arundo donax TaxID=35708 RepID=A0A0A8Y3G1_ARUDO
MLSPINMGSSCCFPAKPLGMAAEVVSNPRAKKAYYTTGSNMRQTPRPIKI